MFRKFLDWARQVLRKMIGKSDIKEKLQTDVAVSGKMADAISLWCEIYEGRAPWLSNTVQPMNLGSAIASEAARLITVEMQSKVTGSARADYLQKQYQRVLDRLRDYCEYGCAKGGIVFKPYIDGANIVIDAVHADRFYPTRFDSAGGVTGAVFVERVTKGKQYYTRLERAELLGSAYHITNKAYKSEVESMLGREISLADVPAWAGVEPEATIQNVDRPLFAYFKAAQANAVDPNSPLGVSVYARAVQQIEEADKQYSRLLWEFEGGELAIDADDTLFRTPGTDRLTLPKGKERLYRAVRIGGVEGSKPINTFSPELRDQSLINGLNAILRRVEYNSGLAYGTLSDPQTVDKTAEEIKASKQRSYANIADNQKAMETVLKQLVYAMDVWATVGDLAPKGSYEISFEWDDSIVVNTEAEQNIRLQEVAAGILNPVEYIKWRYGIKDDAEARKMMPKMQELTE